MHRSFGGGRYGDIRRRLSVGAGPGQFQVALDSRIVRIKPRGAFKCRNRFCMVSLQVKRVTKIVMKAGYAGSLADRQLELGHSAWKVSLCCMNDAQAIVGLGKGVVCRQCLAVCGGGLLQALLALIVATELIESFRTVAGFIDAVVRFDVQLAFRRLG